MSIRKKVVWLPYDMDTAIGINNSGLLTFSYDLEDIDTQQGGEFIFNGQDSVMWTNLRDAFGDDIKAMYQNLRSQGKLSYALVERMFEEHQAKWSEAIFNEDAFFKYIEPLTNPDDGKQPDASYLPMAQGSKAEQRKWWLYNRFRYMDSKWNAGDALTDYIMMRAYSVAPQVLTPYADIYLTTSWDGELTQVRAHRGQTYTLPCPKDSANDAVVAIYSASQLSSVGDLSGLKIKNGNFSMATRLQELKIGDSASTYSNTNLIDLQLGNNTLLRTIDVRNCPNLAITVDLSGCKNIENVYFDGTGIAGVVLPNGGVLTTLHLPDTVTNLTVQNQPNITDFVLNDASNLSTLRLENCGELMDDAKELVAEMEGGSRIRLIGINWEFSTSQQLSDLYDLLDTMRGLDESGGNMPKVQISGVINVEYFSGDMAAMRERYPNVRITADHTSSVIYFYNGSTLITQQTVLDGGDATYSGSTPTKTQDAQYTYSFSGWSRDDDNTVDSDALTAVTADRNVYACFTSTIRTYTVTWVNNGTTIETDTNVPYGTIPHYDGATPTKDGQTSTGWLPDPTVPITGDTTFTAQYLPVYTITFKNDTGTTTLDTQNVVQGGTATYGGTTPTSSEDASLAWLGWATSANSHTANAVLTNIQASATVYAAFESAVEVAEIADSWNTIIANIDNGTYSTKYKVGNYKPLNAGDWDGNEITLNMQIVAFDQDVDATGNTIPVSFISKEVIPNSWANANYTIAPVRLSNITGKIPQNVLNRINSVVKDRASSSGLVSETVKFWIPSAKEVGNGNYAKYQESNTNMYPIFKEQSSRIKKHGDTSENWGLRSINVSGGNYMVINTSGNITDISRYYFVLGFCLGLESETITDDWSTILANQNYATDYSIGDTKMLDLGTEGKHLMEIVAFDEDDRADGNGKAGITWISKDLLSTKHAMNDLNTTTGGWEQSGMRNYLKTTIKPLIPEAIRNAIVSVTKVSSAYVDGQIVKNGQSITDDVWIPSIHEVSSTITTYEDIGASYDNKFDSDQNRIKKNGGSATLWCLRSVAGSTTYRSIKPSGSSSSYDANIKMGIALGFCTN